MQAPPFFAIVHAFQNPYNLVVIICKEEQFTHGNEKLIVVLCKKKINQLKNAAFSCFIFVKLF